MIGERPTTHGITVILDKTDAGISQTPKSELSQDNIVEIGRFLFPKKQRQGEQVWTRLEISTAVNLNPASVYKIIVRQERVGTIQPIQLKLGHIKTTNFYKQSDVELLLPYFKAIKKRCRQGKYGESNPIGNEDEGIGIENKEIRDKSLTKKELLKLKDRVLKLTVIDMLDEIIDTRTDVNYNVRIRLGEHLPHGITIYSLFRNVSHQELNYAFMQVFESAFRTNQNSNKNGDGNEESQPSLIDLEIQERVRIIRQKKHNVDNLINHTKKMFSLNVYQGKEEQ